MMSFCKKSAHSFLGLAASSMDDPVFLPPPSDPTSFSSSFYRCHHHDAIAAVGGLGFIAISEEVHRPAHVLESSAVVKAGPPKRDPGGIGFIDEVGGGVDGLMSCTESLGFESSDERRVDDEMKTCYDDAAWGWTSSKPLMLKSSRWRDAGGQRREARRFPPPLPSLNHNGQPSFFLRPVRKDGRLEITKVRIDRPEILRASRQDGRLTLHLIKEEEEEGVKKEEEEEEEEETPPQEDIQQELEKEEEEEEDAMEDEEEEDEEEYKEEVVEDWRLTAAVGNSSGGEGLRRCHELVQQHQQQQQHYHLHGWCQPCVTSR